MAVWRACRSAHFGGPGLSRNRQPSLTTLASWGFVGPRTGPLRRTQEQKEDYVLRRVLVAQKRTGLLRFPFKVHASNQTPGAPDFVIEGAGGNRGIGGDGGRRPAIPTVDDELEANPSTETAHLVPGDGWTARHVSRQIREAIERKSQKFDGGGYQDDPCDLAVYNNTEDVADESVIEDVRGACLAGRFGHVHVLDGDRVYMDVLEPSWSRIDLHHDYSIDFCGWIADQVESLRNEDLSRLDIENLIEELNALAKRDEKALKNRLKNLLAHLLKWHHQSSGRSSSWRGTIYENCTRIDDLLESRLVCAIGSILQGKVVARASVEQGPKPPLRRGLQRRNSRRPCLGRASSPTLREASALWKRRLGGLVREE